MTDTTIDTDFVRRFAAKTEVTECDLCGLRWEECVAYKTSAKGTPCDFVRRFFAEMTDEQRAWLSQAVEEKLKAEKGRK